MVPIADPLEGISNFKVMGSAYPDECMCICSIFGRDMNDDLKIFLCSLLSMLKVSGEVNEDITQIISCQSAHFELNPGFNGEQVEMILGKASGMAKGHTL